MTAHALPRVTLGQGLEVSALGLGTMGMAEFYGPSDERESVLTIRQAIESGVDFIDTAYMYGGGRSEAIVGRALAEVDRDRVVLATKCGLIRTADNVRIDGRPEHIRRAIDESLARLGTDHVDLYYLHRVDPEVPVEESIGAMAEQVTAGKVRLLGISEANAQTLRRAHATHPMAALQSEYSLCTREPERELLPACRELGIGFVAWGPLGRGLLTGTVRRAEFGADDVRSILPRFGADSLAANLALVDRVAELARELDCTPAQLALAFDIARGTVPIQGAMDRAQLAENLRAAELTLDAEVLARLDAIVPVGAFDGARFHAPMLAAVEK
ncbi:aldo/keto reductase [Kitasatospora sp. LaBMicrA B282]|uniref:aldo/keto reductase n=1 Tax=Kitasatospora sp. LaBMicrA B282 TaxID=3420949 RepID=UPI003D11A7A7